MRYTKDGAECNCEYGWEKVNNLKHQVMDNFFGQHIDKDQKCEVFCIEGVPAASMVYKNTNSHGEPFVDAFFINRAMIFRKIRSC